VHYLGRDYEVAPAERKEALKRSPDSPVALLVLGLVSEAKHHRADALQEYQTVLAVRRSQAAAFYRAQTARALALSGKLTGFARGQPNLATPIEIWPIWLWWTRRLASTRRRSRCPSAPYCAGEVSLTWPKVDPVFDPVRNEPRFQALISTNGIPQLNPAVRINSPRTRPQSRRDSPIGTVVSLMC